MRYYRETKDLHGQSNHIHVISGNQDERLSNKRKSVRRLLVAWKEDVTGVLHTLDETRNKSVDWLQTVHKLCFNIRASVARDAKLNCDVTGRRRRGAISDINEQRR